MDNLFKDKDKLVMVGYAAISLAYLALFIAKYKSVKSK
jgi:hypothetical protein